MWLQFKVDYSRTYTICIFISGICIGLYFFTLAKAYQSGKMSIAYPVARTFPILVVTWAGIFLDEMPSTTGLAGIGLIVAGCFILPLKKFEIGEDGFAVKHYLNWSCFWALMCAVITSAYSLIDKYAASTTAAADQTANILMKINYVYLQNSTGWITLLILLKLFSIKTNKESRGHTAYCGFVFLISYSLIMLAFTTDMAAHVVSLRQLSIVIGAVISMKFIEKSFSIPRIIGVITIFIGTVIVSLAG
jgi:uncharacterized membrane protein